MCCESSVRRDVECTETTMNEIDIISRACGIHSIQLDLCEVGTVSGYIKSIFLSRFLQHHSADHLWTIFSEKCAPYFVFCWEHHAQSDQNKAFRIDNDDTEHISQSFHIRTFLAQGLFAHDTRLRSILRHLNSGVCNRGPWCLCAPDSRVKHSSFAAHIFEHIPSLVPREYRSFFWNMQRVLLLCRHFEASVIFLKSPPLNSLHSILCFHPKQQNDRFGIYSHSQHHGLSVFVRAPRIGSVG